MMPKRKAGKSKVVCGLEFLGIYLIYKWMLLLPLAAAYRLSENMFWLVFWLDTRHRQRTIHNLQHAGVASGKKSAARLAYCSYRHHARLLAEVFKADQWYAPERINAAGNAAGRRFFEPESGATAPQMILITAHYGNWEIAGKALPAMTRRPMTSLMRVFDNPRIGKLIVGKRTGRQHTSIDKRHGIRPLLRAANRGDNLALLIDQHAGGGEGVVCRFFGHPAKIHRTPALLHLKTGIPIVPEVTRRLPGDGARFSVVCGAPITYRPTGNREYDVQCLTQKCITALEELIREEPEQWLWTPRHWLDLDRKPRGSEAVRQAAGTAAAVLVSEPFGSSAN